MKSHVLILFFAAILFSSCDREPRLKIETEFGDMIMELREDTPKHRENILKLAEEGYYDDLLFHRVMGGFMLQTGDPDSKGAPAGQNLGVGGPGYTISAEFTGGLHVRGAVAAARQMDRTNPDRNSSGSQFYIVDGTPIDENNLGITLARNKTKKYTDEEKQAYLDAGAGAPFLDDAYTVFGQIVEGLDVIDKIAAVQVNNLNRPAKDIPIKVSVIR